MKSIAFFNNKGGVGKTSLVYHLSWMLADLRFRVVAVDLDPQANLTSMFIPDEDLELIWTSSKSETIYRAIDPLYRGVGSLAQPSIRQIADRVGLLVGDLALSGFEDELSAQWSACADKKERGYRVTTAFAELIRQATEEFEADVALIDVGPNLGAINRAALIACNDVVIPLGPDLFSVQGLRNMGPRLRGWREEWDHRREICPFNDLVLPSGAMTPIGYVLMRHSTRLDRPVKAYERWISRIPSEYRVSILADDSAGGGGPIAEDPHCLARLKDYRSLMPMAQESRKPMFKLRPADGAIGGHQTAVSDCYSDFHALAKRIQNVAGVPDPI